MIRFCKEDIRDLSFSSSREWLETNGLGGYAASAICGMNNRRYHGLLVAATRPPVERTMLLSNLVETLRLGAEIFELSTHRFASAIHPEGYRLLAEFRLDPWPVTVLETGSLRIEKSVTMLHGENTTVIRYRLLGSRQACVTLELRPLLAFRNHHSLTRENEALCRGFDQEKGVVRLSLYQGLPTMCLAHNAAEVSPTGFWYRDFYYEEDARRGQECREDLWQPIRLTFELGEGRDAILVASSEERQASEAEVMLRRERARREEIVSAAIVGSRQTSPLSALREALTAAADAFLVRRDGGMTIVAGYPWFTDWSRDTMIALEGLTLCTRRPAMARDILLAFALHIRQGMLPNRFPDAGEEPEYNNVDGTLWYFHAVDAYLRAVGDDPGFRQVLTPKLTEILDWHLNGTLFGIGVDKDGLLKAGAPGLQLTWMDAKIGDWVVTPRAGKPVEIQALWYNALRVMERLAGMAGDPKAEEFSECALRAKHSFRRKFWNPDPGCLYDVLEEERKDGSIRPNQLIALSLPHTMVTPERARQILAVAQRDLLTPAGLRTLAPDDPSYRGRYDGGMRERDIAYHQGTVWPWLAGPYLTALLRFGAPKSRAREEAKNWLLGFAPRLLEGGVGQASEVYDGDAPHRPSGCPAQAWSVGELLRAVCLLEVERV